MYNTSSFESFVDSISKSSTLSAEREYELFCDYKQNKNLHSKYEIVTSYLKLVLSIAKDCLQSGNNLDDLFQEGTCGLLKSIETFDHTLGHRFSTYAQYQIKFCILRFLQNQNNIIRYIKTKEQSKIFYNLHKYQRDNNSFSDLQLTCIATDLNVPIDDVRRMEKFMFYHDVLLDHIEYEEDIDIGLTSDILLTIIKDEDELYLQERKYLNDLNTRERDIIESRWVDDKTTFLDLSKRYNISSQRVAQIEKAAFRKIRKHYERNN